MDEPKPPALTSVPDTLVPAEGTFTVANAKRAADMARRAHAARAENRKSDPPEDSDSAEARIKVDSLPAREELADRATAVVLDVLNRILINKIKVTGANAKAIAEMAFTITRLESGDPTSISGNMTREQIMTSISALRDAAEKRQKRDAGLA